MRCSSRPYLWWSAARLSPGVPDLHRALVTSVFQPREMQFDSGCSCPDSSWDCIKKASQQCWQEYIYRDCVAFQESGWGWRWLPQVASAGRQAIWSPHHLSWTGPHPAGASETASLCCARSFYTFLWKINQQAAACFLSGFAVTAWCLFLGPLWTWWESGRKETLLKEDLRSMLRWKK